MTPLAETILWCIVQVTLVGLVAWLLCVAVSRWLGPGAAAVPAAALAAVVMLTVLAFAPWPAAWRFGPDWPQGESSATTAEDTPAASGSLTGMKIPASWLANLGGNGGDSASATSPVEHSSNATATAELPSDSPESAPAASPIAWLPIALFALLGTGILLGLLRLVGGLLSVRNHRRGSEPLRDAALLELADCLRAELCLQRPVELRESDRLATAATVGWSRPVVLLPRAWREWTADQRRAVLAHELAHVARGDYLACVLAQLSVAIHFYHPLVHWLAARLRLEQELAADATAARLAGGNKLYLQSLAELALHTTERSLGWPAHPFLPTQGTFLRRIEMLRDSKLADGAAPPSKWTPRWIAAGLLVAAILLAGLRGGSKDSPFDAAALAQAPATPAGATTGQSGIDLSQVNNDAKLFLAFRPTEIAKVPEIREALAGPLREMAAPFTMFSLDGIEQITIVGQGEATHGFGENLQVIVLQFSKPTSFETIAKGGAWQADAVAVTARSATGPAGAPPRQAYGVVNDRTIVLGTSDMVARHLTNRRKGMPPIAAGAGWEKVRAGAVVAALDLEVVRELFRQRPQGAPPPDATFTALAPLWTDAEYVLGGILLDGKSVHVRLIATSQDAELAEHVAETSTAALTLARNALRSARENEKEMAAYAKLAAEMAAALLNSVKIQRTDALVVAETSTELPQEGSKAATALAGALTQARADAQRMQSTNNLKQIMLAMHNWAATYKGGFPPPVLMGIDGKGKVPHSWRVAILPFLEQNDLYRQYRFDEPWDSEANKLVLAKMPAIYRHPLDDPKSTNASYFVLRSEVLKDTTPASGGGESAPEGGFPTVFSGKSGVNFSQMFDGTSNIIGVVEAKRDIPWTKPEDILFDPAKDLPKLGGFSKEGFNAAFADGSIHFLQNKIDPKILKLLIMPQDGTPIPQY
jgi:beta-lactamase regulating signal transducer with metallopeptidase domain